LSSSDSTSRADAEPIVLDNRCSEATEDISFRMRAAVRFLLATVKQRAALSVPTYRPDSLFQIRHRHVRTPQPERKACCARQFI
jgi:hypothetical protein